MNYFADFELLIQAILAIVPAVEKIFPHANAGINQDAAVLAKINLVTSLVTTVVPSLTAGQPDAIVAHVTAHLPNVVAAIGAVQDALAAPVK